METDIKETINKLREVEKKCIKSRYETYGSCQCQGCRYALEQHKYLALLETWAKDHEKAKIISKEIGIDEVVLDMKELISNDVSRYLEHMYSFETAVNHSPMFYRDIENIRHWNTIGAIDYNRPMTTPLYQGLRENNLNLIREGCKQIDINELDPYGKTPLMYACLHCTLEIVKALVEDGSDVNKRDLLGWTPLFYCKDTAIADYLLSVGADINAQDYRGNNLLLHNILDPMGDSGFAFSPNTPLIELFINRGIDVNAKDNKGYTALMRLIGGIRIKDKKEILTLLRQAPATDVNIKNAEGKTAIDIVKENINKTIEYARLRQAIEEQRGTIGGCVVGDEPEDYVPPRKEVKLPEIDEVELTIADKEDIEECNKIIDMLKKCEGK